MRAPARYLAASSCGRFGPGRRGSALATVAALPPIDPRLITFDELLHQPARVVVAVLDRGRLHEVRARPLEGSADAAVQRQFGAAHRVNDDARRVGGVYDLELELDVERHVAERTSLEADVGPLPVVEPGHVVRRPDVHVVLADVVVELGRDRARLRDLLRHQPLPLQHVQEVGVAAEVELVGALELDAAITEQAGQHSVDDGRADLGLDVVADDRQTLVLEALLPVRLTRDEDGDAVDKADPGGQRLLDVPLGRLFRADRQVADEHVGLALLEDADDVRGFAGRLLDDVGQVLADAVMGHASLYLHARPWHFRELHRVVRLGEDRVREVEADLVLVDVERGHELDVPDVVAAEVDVHQARDRLLGRGVAVVVHALNERGGAVAHPDDGDADLVVAAALVTVPAIGAHAPTSSRTFGFATWGCERPSISSRRWR